MKMISVASSAICALLGWVELWLVVLSISIGRSREPTLSHMHPRHSQQVVMKSHVAVFEHSPLQALIRFLSFAMVKVSVQTLPVLTIDNRSLPITVSQQVDGITFIPLSFENRRLTNLISNDGGYRVKKDNLKLIAMHLQHLRSLASVPPQPAPLAPPNPVDNPDIDNRDDNRANKRLRARGRHVPATVRQDLSIVVIEAPAWNQAKATSIKVLPEVDHRSMLHIEFCQSAIEYLSMACRVGAPDPADRDRAGGGDGGREPVPKPEDEPAAGDDS